MCSILSTLIGYFFLIFSNSQSNFNVHNSAAGVGWGYKGNTSVESISFMVDKPVLVGGVGLYGGRGDYEACVTIATSPKDEDVIARVNKKKFTCAKEYFICLYNNKKIVCCLNTSEVSYIRK